MPSRADEYWASEKEDLRYCYKHKHYYRVDFSCQLCILEKIEQQFPKEVSNEVSVELIECPVCAEKSLAWFDLQNQYECMSPRCRSVFSKEKLNQILKPNISMVSESVDTKLDKPFKKANLGKCPICWKITVYFASEKNVYECLKCQRVYSESEYKTLMETHDGEPKGKGWFGNEYFDPKKKKWSKS